MTWNLADYFWLLIPSPVWEHFVLNCCPPRSCENEKSSLPCNSSQNTPLCRTVALLLACESQTLRYCLNPNVNEKYEKNNNFEPIKKLTKSKNLRRFSIKKILQYSAYGSLYNNKGTQSWITRWGHKYTNLDDLCQRSLKMSGIYD
jgi:hypothetical protein